MGELWWTEKQTPNFGITFKVNSVLFHDRNEFAEIEVFDTEEFGRVLALDGAVQLTQRDEFFYAETMAHTAVAYAKQCMLNLCKPSLKILIIGGGDLSIARELLKYPPEVVAEVQIVDINPMVTHVARQYFDAKVDLRVQVAHEDALKYVRLCVDKEYDVAIIDSTDPVGPAKGLFGKQFIKDLISNVVKGPILAQTCSPFFHPHVLEEMIQIARELEFPIVQPLVGFVPTYPSGLWSYLMMSTEKPLRVPQKLPTDLRYFSEDVFEALHATPTFYRGER